MQTKFQTAISTLFLAGAAALSTVSLLPQAAQAAAPQVRTQAPGFYRIMLGDVEVTALSDGTVTIPLDQLLTHTAPAHVGQVLASHHLGTQVETSINAFLVNTGTRLVLIDAGAGTSFGAHAGGRLLQSIRAAGYRPGDIDAVLLTHIHGDHSNGLTVDGKAVFPNADVYVDEHDVTLWLDPSSRDKVAKGHAHMVDEALVAFAPYRQAGKLKTFHGAVEVIPGIRSVPTPGHTPGHTVYEVSGGGQTVRFLGDLLHAKDVQMAEPNVTISFDEDANAARRGASAKRCSPMPRRAVILWRQRTRHFPA